MSVKEGVRSDVQEACREYITSCREYIETKFDGSLNDALEDATVDIQSVKELSRDEFGDRQSIFTTTQTVVQPSQLISEIPDSYAKDAFESVASQLVEATNYSLEKSTHGSGDSANEEELLRKQFQNSLAEFAGEVMDYAGEVVFHEEVFEAAYDQQFFPERTDREVYDIIIPMPNVRLEREIELPDIPTLETVFEGPYGIEQLAVKPLTHQLDSGIRTYHALSRGHTSFSDHPPEVVIHVRLRRRRPYKEIQSEIGSGSSPPIDPRDVSVFANDLASWYIHDLIVRELLNTLRRTLYLWNQRVEPEFENGYLLAPNWLDYRESVSNIVDEFYVENGQSQGTLTFSSERESFSDFWSLYAGYLTDRRSFIKKPVNRLESMFDRESPEDAILDALIALEGLLLQETNGSSYTFRLKLRSRLLLENLSQHDWSPEKTGTIAAELYRLRGRLIHHDDRIEEAIETEDLNQLSDLSGYEIMIRARTLLAHVVLAFLDQYESYELRPRHVTEAIDQAALTASYDPNKAQEIKQD